MTQLFDLSSPEGRVNTARILCDLRRIRKTLTDPEQESKRKRSEIKG